MIRVTVRYYVLFFIAAGNRMEESVDLPEGSTLSELLEELGRRHKDMGRRVWTRRGTLSPLAWIMLNGRHLAGEPSLVVQLDEGDIIALTTPLMVGG